MKKIREYARKRDFKKTPEPSCKVTRTKGALQYVIQKHAASRLHYDFRLEIDGVLVSWAVLKGPSLNPGDKHLAVMTEDHPFDYKNFEGVIPIVQYGGGEVIIWDQGKYYAEKDGEIEYDRQLSEKVLRSDLKKGKAKKTSRPAAKHPGKAKAMGRTAHKNSKRRAG
jgi:bifunctional non-homologous end joining protein LigD